jgi:hypothetical protein
MSLMQRFTAMADDEVTHLALDAARIGAAAAADAATSGNGIEQRVAPLRQALRGERPRLAASCA